MMRSSCYPVAGRISFFAYGLGGWGRGRKGGGVSHKSRLCDRNGRGWVVLGLDRADKGMNICRITRDGGRWSLAAGFIFLNGVCGSKNYGRILERV